MSEKISFTVNRSNAADIAAHLFHADPTFVPTLSSRVDIHTYAQKLNDQAFRFEAWLGQQLIGLVAIYCNQVDCGKAFVTNVSVWPECQGQGIARSLMRQCIDHVRSHGFGQMELEVAQHSLAAVLLYKKLGFNTLCSSGSKLTMRATLK